MLGCGAACCWAEVYQNASYVSLRNETCGLRREKNEEDELLVDLLEGVDRMVPKWHGGCKR